MLLPPTPKPAPMHKDIRDLLNQQIAIELQSSQLYLSMATWADLHNYQGSAHFLYQQSQEERDHMMKIIHYLIESTIPPIIPSTQATQSQYPSLQALFQKALQSEQQVTQAIHRIVHQALQQKDYTTFNFLQWFVQEQKEEETTAQKANALFTLIGTQRGIDLYTIDQEIKKLRPQ